MEQQKTDCLEGDLTRRQVEIFNLLRRLWIEHIMWTRSFIISTASDLGDLDAVTKRLLQNPTDFAYVLSLLYGNQKAMEFENLFTEHLLIAAQMVNAAKAGDTKTVDEQRQKWYNNADDIAAFLASINAHWSQHTWQAMFYDHLKMTENEAVQILTGKYAESIVQYDAMQEQALKMADYMACGIIKQFEI